MSEDIWDVRITDTSLRDGSHHKRHQFTKDEVQGIVAALDAAGVPVIEVTHGDGLGGSSFNYGFSKTPEQELIKLAAETAQDAKIAFLNLTPSEPTVDVLRNQGFMMGFGIDVKDANDIGDEDDPRIVGHDYTNGNPEGGRKAMENLLQINPDINVIHTINEPAAVGAYQALKAVGKENDVLIVSVDGGCPGVASVKDGVIGATSQQYPLMMAALGVEAIKKWADTGEKPQPTPGKAFFDTGVALITDKPAEGVPSIDTAKGTELCWG